MRDAGQFIGEMALFADESLDNRRTASVRARGEVVVLVVTEEDVEAILQQTPEAAEQIQRTIARRKSDAIVTEVKQRIST